MGSACNTCSSKAEATASAAAATTRAGRPAWITAKMGGTWVYGLHGVLEFGLTQLALRLLSLASAMLSSQRGSEARNEQR